MIEPLAGALLAGSIIGALAGGLLFQRFFARRALDLLIANLDTLIDGPSGSRLQPIADPRATQILERLAARLVGIETLASVDQLTNVLNRPASLRLLAGELERGSRHDRPIAVALADIDHFKKVNDTYGHLAGDLVLRHVAKLLRSDLRATDAVGRYGGEEFLLILPETDEQAAFAAMEKLRRLVGRTAVTLPDGSEIAVTMSIGLAAGPAGQLRLDQVTRDADSALYAAKSLGRDQVYVFRAADDERTIRRMALSRESRDAALGLGRAAADAAQERLVEMLGPRPGWAGRPSVLIADLSVHVARTLGLSDGEVLRIHTASLLHDVGKLAIPESVLSKPSRLSEAELRTVMEHPRVGQIVLEQAGAMRDAAAIALHHHEWFNGRGYPHGLAAADIPLGARIVALADAYEAMTSWRPYKQTKSHEEALAELRRCAGTQFDPELVELFVAQFPAAFAAEANEDQAGSVA